jgi:hypothetical protein
MKVKASNCTKAFQRPFRKSRTVFAVSAEGNQTLPSKSKVVYKKEVFTLAAAG